MAEKPEPDHSGLELNFEDASVVREYRIPLPLTVDDYHIGQLYGVAEASKNETGGGEGVEVVLNEPFEVMRFGQPLKGQYTYKIIHLKNKVPGIIRTLAPKGALEMHERAWNAYPFCRTVYTNPYMKDAFYICLDTWHKPMEKGKFIENVHGIKGALLEKRDIDHVDIVNDPCQPSDYKADEDPTLVRSEKAGRGPFQGPKWEANQDPAMCAYKLYRVKFKWFGLQTKVEKIIMGSVRRLLFTFHRQVVCWLDKWYGMTIQDIRDLEDKTKKDLDDMRQTGELKGSKISD